MEDILYHKKKLCYTEVSEFTDFQGVGNDLLYKRYTSVFNVIRNNIEEKYRDFLAQPVYSANEDRIYWYVSEWTNNTIPCAYKDLLDSDKEKYERIKDKTLEVYNSAIKRLSNEDKQILMGALKYVDEDFIFCYDDKVVLVAWGMKPDSNSYTVKGTVMHDLVIKTRYKIKFNSGDNGTLKEKYKGVISKEKDYILKDEDLPIILPNKGFEFKGWNPNPIGTKVKNNLEFVAEYDEVVINDSNISDVDDSNEEVKVIFLPGDYGQLDGISEIMIPQNTYISEEDIPNIESNTGYRFVGWDNSINAIIDKDTVFTAQYEREMLTCSFVSGENGNIEGEESFEIPFGAHVDEDMIPKVIPKKGYKFLGWDKSPINHLMNSDAVFTAQYEEKLPWYKRLWTWFTNKTSGIGIGKGKGCLQWVLRLLLLLLLLWLLSLLFRQCDGMGSKRNKVRPSDKYETPDGRIMDDNGPVKDIVGDEGKLPDNNNVAPIVGNDGSVPPIKRNPGSPDVVDNRLNLYFEDAGVNLDQFVADLSKVYSNEQCKVIGVDRNVPMIQIMIPEEDRSTIRETINKKLPNYDFFVVDESIFSLVGTPSNDEVNIGWHITTINLEIGWTITKGDPNIIVAVVDDGIDATHEIFENRIVKPYNVFTQNNSLSTGIGHGTHVAGLAVGSDKKIDEGISGVAPKCKLMPIQVFDNGYCTFSSVTSGIMYAIHNGADVVNVSIGPKFEGLDVLPISDQNKIAETTFKNEEKVWKKIIKVANENNVIIVFAAGNDNILANIAPENRSNKSINVAAVDSKLEKADFTNFGKGSNISAPGKGITSSVPNNEYKIYDGTSMAAPIVSGVVALMKSCRKDINIDEVLNILQSTGKRVSANIPPMIQVDKALDVLKNGTIPNNGNNNIDEEHDKQDMPTNNSDNDFADNKERDDYSEIRKMIEFYKKKIEELEGQLPENKN